MKKGLVLGKFMPFHQGHIALIDFAAQSTTTLVVLVCANKNEPIDARIRYQWVKEYYRYNENIEVVLSVYDETKLSSSSVSSEDASRAWASWLKENFPATDIFISSEPYGELVARYWGIDFLIFERQRKTVPVSATAIRLNPFYNWQYLPALVRPYFVKKICIVGAESTGKSVLAERLAAHYQTSYVSEAARDIVGATEECTVADLYKIAVAHANAINEKIRSANKLLFIDTDITITRSYGHFLFNVDMHIEDWIEEANRFDLYLFLETDCPHVQDGTRLNESARDRLNDSHKKEFAHRAIAYESIHGDWENRFTESVRIIDRTFFEITV